MATSQYKNKFVNYGMLNIQIDVFITQSTVGNSGEMVFKTISNAALVTARKQMACNLNF